MPALRPILTVLADAFPDPRLIRLIADDADLRPGAINFQGSADFVWNELILEARRHGMLKRVIDVALERAPALERSPAIQEAYAQSEDTWTRLNDIGDFDIAAYRRQLSAKYARAAAAYIPPDLSPVDPAAYEDVPPPAGRRLFAEAIAPHQRCIVLGRPGIGKSAMLQYLAYQACTITEVPSAPVAGGLCIYLELARFRARTDMTGLEQLEALISESIYIRQGGDERPDPREVNVLLERAGGLLLLDGLNEVAAEVRASCLRAIVDFADRRPLCRYILTARRHNLAIPALMRDWSVMEIQPFSDGQLEATLARPGVGAPARAVVEAALLEGNQLLRVPLFLELALRHDPGQMAGERRLKHSQSSVVRGWLEELLARDERDLKRGDVEGGSSERLRRTLHRTAELMHERGQVLPEDVVRHALDAARATGEGEAAGEIRELCERGILILNDGYLRFWHQTLQDYCFCGALVARWRAGGRIGRRIPRWFSRLARSGEEEERLVMVVAQLTASEGNWLTTRVSRSNPSLALRWADELMQDGAELTAFDGIVRRMRRMALRCRRFSRLGATRWTAALSVLVASFLGFLAYYQIQVMIVLLVAAWLRAPLGVGAAWIASGLSGLIATVVLFRRRRAASFEQASALLPVVNPWWRELASLAEEPIKLAGFVAAVVGFLALIALGIRIDLESMQAGAGSSELGDALPTSLQEAMASIERVVAEMQQSGGFEHPSAHQRVFIYLSSLIYVNMLTQVLSLLSAMLSPIVLLLHPGIQRFEELVGITLRVGSPELRRRLLATLKRVGSSHLSAPYVTAMASGAVSMDNPPDLVEPLRASPSPYQSIRLLSYSRDRRVVPFLAGVLSLGNAWSRVALITMATRARRFPLERERLAALALPLHADIRLDPVLRLRAARVLRSCGRPAASAAALWGAIAVRVGIGVFMSWLILFAFSSTAALKNRFETPTSGVLLSYAAMVSSVAALVLWDNLRHGSGFIRGCRALDSWRPTSYAVLCLWAPYVGLPLYLLLRAQIHRNSRGIDWEAARATGADDHSAEQHTSPGA